MAELVDALDSGSSEEIRKSSTLFMSTTKKLVEQIDFQLTFSLR